MYINKYFQTLQKCKAFFTLLKSATELEISEDNLFLILLASSQSSREGMKELASRFLLTEVSGLPSLGCVS